MAAAARVVYPVALAAGGLAVWRRPFYAVYAFVVGLALHNAMMAALFALGVENTPLTLIAAWKEGLLAIALARVARDAVAERRLPFRPSLVDALALVFAAFVFLYAVLPQSALGGQADATTVLYALRHHLACVAAYFLGRSIVLLPLRRLVLVTATVVAILGVVEAYTVPINSWEDADVPAYFREQLGFEHHGPRGLPENFVFNTGDESDLLRRAVSTFLSPLGPAYLLVVALCLWAVRPRSGWLLAAIAAVGLLFTFTRAAMLVLACALLVLGFVQRRWWPVAAAVLTLATAVIWTQVYPSIAPETTWSQADLRYQRDQAEKLGVTPGETVALDEPSIRNHLRALRDGVETVARHPQGYGLGNAGATALRHDVPLKAGESTYTELGVDTGLLGALAFIGWSAVLLWSLVRARASAIAAAFAAVLALGVQTDVLGTPWLAFVVWLLAGAGHTAALRSGGDGRDVRSEGVA